MLGSRGGCSGPVSWWCSEVLRCTPKVAPNPAPTLLPAQMADCDQCNVRFTLLRRKRECGGCGLLFCGSCLKRGMGGTRRCNKCLVLTQWPLDLSEVTALRVKDLRHFLHSRDINTATCTEKRDLIDLVTRHISSQHRRGGAAARHSTPAAQATQARAPAQANEKSTPCTSSITRDDGIRVRPTSSHSGSVGSIRVRPMDSIRVRPCPSLSPDSSDYDPEADLGIRVFASEQPNSPQDTPNNTSSASGVRYEGREGDCSHCPSDEWTASCCSLESCHNGTPSRLPLCPHQEETSSQNSEEWVFVPDRGATPGPTDTTRQSDMLNETYTHPLDSSQTELSSENRSQTEGVSSTMPAPPSAPPLQQEEEEQQSFPAPTSSSSSSSPSSSAPTSAMSSPEPSKGVVAGIVSLGSIKSEEDIHQLSVRQCKELLTLHRVTYTGVREKSELFSKIKILWEDHRNNTRKDMENLPEELMCKICMDSVIDCVLLECGHMVACIQCGKQMSECPMCRQYVVRVVRTFRA